MPGFKYSLWLATYSHYCLPCRGISRKGVGEGGTALAGDTQAQIPAYGYVGLWIPTCKQGEGTEVKGTHWALGMQSAGASPRCHLNADVRQQELLCEYHLLWYEIRHP